MVVPHSRYEEVGLKRPLIILFYLVINMQDEMNSLLVLVVVAILLVIGGGIILIGDNTVNTYDISSENFNATASVAKTLSHPIYSVDSLLSYNQTTVTNTTQKSPLNTTYFLTLTNVNPGTANMIISHTIPTSIRNVFVNGNNVGSLTIGNSSSFSFPASFLVNGSNNVTIS